MHTQQFFCVYDDNLMCSTVQSAALQLALHSVKFNHTKVVIRESFSKAANIQFFGLVLSLYSGLFDQLLWIHLWIHLLLWIHIKI